MSWDVVVCRFSRTYTRMNQIDEDGSLLPMGSRAHIHAAISALFPDTDWSEPGWGKHQGPFGSVVFSVSDEEPVDSVMPHVRAGEGIVAPIVELCLKHGWQAMDTTAGTFLEQKPVPEQGVTQWMAYRNQVLGQRQDPSAALPGALRRKRWTARWRRLP